MRTTKTMRTPRSPRGAARAGTWIGPRHPLATHTNPGLATHTRPRRKHPAPGTVQVPETSTDPNIKHARPCDPTATPAQPCRRAATTGATSPSAAAHATHWQAPHSQGRHRRHRLYGEKVPECGPLNSVRKCRNTRTRR